MLALRNLSKEFASVGAVREVSLEIATGEFLAVVGPSGCGKTTLLRMIAGFETPTAGAVLLDDRDITPLPPQRRRIGMVFQHYALFPHMTVRENIAFGLDAQGRGAAEIADRTARSADRVRLADKLDVKVPLLSGGEQQRVAVARAIVTEPSVLLFDEPLSNLDPMLRDELRAEIVRVQRETGITAVYVTHDQSEALALADRVAVMRRGRVEQCAAPRDVFFKPANAFVATFIGGAQILPATLRQRASGPVAEIAEGLTVDCGVTAELRALPDGASVEIAMKPEALSLRDGGASMVIASCTFVGASTEIVVTGEGVRLRGRIHSTRGAALSVGDRVGVFIDPALCTVFPQ